MSRSAAQIAAQKKAAKASAAKRRGTKGAQPERLGTIVKRAMASPPRTPNPWYTPENVKKWAASDAKVAKAADAARALQQTPAFKRTAKKLGPNASHEQIKAAMGTQAKPSVNSRKKK